MFYNLVTGRRPIFIGWLEQFIGTQASPLTVADIKSITFSLSFKNSDTIGEYSRYLGSRPIEEFQKIPVDKNEVIISEPIAQELFAVLQLEPFQANFFLCTSERPNFV